MGKYHERYLIEQFGTPSNPAPHISAITPNSGPTAGGTVITDLHGSGFLPGATVKIGGVLATSVVYVSVAKLTCIAPAGSAGAKNVLVTNPDFQTSGSSGNGLFTYVAAPVVTSITPVGGPLAGGTAITDLHGTGFQNGATVKIGGVAATSVVFVSSAKLTCVSPAGTAGAKNVVVTNPDSQTSGTSGNGLYTYGAAPTVTAVTPNSGPASGGQAITDLHGTGFQNGATVRIGGTLATAVTFVSSVKLTCTAPAGAVGAQDILVTNPDTQNSGATGNGLYTYIAAPTVTAITPNSGSSAGGQAITDLHGTGFQNGATATIGGAAVTGVAFVSSAQLTGTTPAGTPGAQNVVVTNPDTQTSGASGNGLYTYNAAFDLATLNLTLYLKPENLTITHPIVGQTQADWPSAASIGTSGDGRVAFDTGDVLAHINDGPVLGPGQPTLFLNRGVNSPFEIFTDGTHATQVNGADVVSTTDASGWALVNIASITGGTGTFTDPAVMGIYQPRLALLVGGVTNDQAEVESAFGTPLQTPVPLTVWTLIQWRFNQVTGTEIRINQGAWAQKAQGALTFFGEPYVLGANGQGPSMNGDYAHLGASQVKFDDATFDNIYNSIKTNYPGAALP